MIGVRAKVMRCSGERALHTFRDIMPTKPNAKKAEMAASSLAKNLVERMLKEMEGALDNPKIMKDEDWKALFGDKQNMIVHVQKLVQTLGALPENKRTRKKSKILKDEPRLSAEDTALLVAWLKEQAKDF